MNKLNIRTVIFIAIGVVLAMGVAFYWFLEQERSSMQSEVEEVARLQREAMQEELANLSDEYEHQYSKLTINGQEVSLYANSDSLLRQISAERAKVDRLLEELQQQKTTSAAPISELTKEVGTLRRVLRNYVVQIDSLHAANEKLRAENKEVKENFQRATDEARQLATQKTQLTERINLAAKLDATAIAITPLDRKGKRAKRIDRVENIQISFRVAKNITAEVGNKTFYTRIMTPDDQPMIKAGAGSFSFEGKSLPYSTRREVEYSGEETEVVMYWPVEESLRAGTYRVMIFADGNLIGTGSFTL